jgi:ABC-type Zn uptake system ZnuABC Zn-binding protein ZnuA
MKALASVAGALLLAATAGWAARPSLVVTTSMLEEAVAELGDAAEGVEVVRLLPPGSCPGHFDLSPRSVPDLRSASAILRHDYQGILEEKLSLMGITDATVVVAETSGSPLIPGNYAQLVRRVAEVVARLLPDRRVELERAAARVDRRMQRLEVEIAERRSPWRGARVLAAFQQAQFARFLGLDVVGEIGRSEDTSPRELEALLGLEPTLVVANIQEGVQAATSLAGRLGVPVVVLSNFPDVEGYGTGYEGLIRANLERLDEGWRRR